MPATAVFIDDHRRLCVRHCDLLDHWNRVGLRYFDGVRGWYWDLDWNGHRPVNWHWNVPGHLDWVGFRDVDGIGPVDWHSHWYLQNSSCRCSDKRCSMIFPRASDTRVDQIIRIEVTREELCACSVAMLDHTRLARSKAIDRGM